MVWKKRPSYQYLVLLVVLAIGLRLPNISRDSLWFDEAISYLAAMLSLPKILNNTVQSSHPPGYYLVLHFWQYLGGYSDSFWRLPGIIWNILLIPLIYRLAKDLFHQQSVALIAGLLVALSPFHVLYSHELRMYTQLMFLATLAAWAYWQARHKMTWLWWGLFGLAGGAAVFTHLFAFLVLAAIGLHALIYRDNKRALWRTAVVIGMICLLFLPWLNLILSESQRGLGSLRPLTQTNVRNPIKPLISLTFLLFGISNNVIYSGIALFLALALLLILMMELRRLRQEGFRSEWVLLILLAGIVLGIPVTVYLIRPFFLPERTMAAASPFLILLLAWSTTRIRSPLPYLVGAAAVAMLMGTFFYHIGPPLKPPYRESTDFITQHAQSGDTVLHTSDGSYLPSLRYAQLQNHAVLDGDPDPRKPDEVYGELGGTVWTIDEATSQSSRLWVVIALEHSIEWQQEQAHIIAGSYAEQEMHEFGGILVYLYEPSE